MNKRLAFVHFQPVEKYPPVVNLVESISKVCTKKHIQLQLYTNSSSDQNSEYIPPVGIYISRIAQFNTAKQWWKRIGGYFKFYLVTVWKLLITKPQKVLVYETVSILPVWLWSFCKPRQSKIFIHYHEYTSPEEYKVAPFILKLNHIIEKRLINKAVWVSHTNERRLSEFLKDFQLQQHPKYQLMANYPPSSWVSSIEQNKLTKTGSQKIRVVYVGALSLETMYVKEFAEWVSSHPNLIEWDIYSQQSTEDLFSFLQQKKTDNITIKGFAEYKALPSILDQYDAGVILYKGHSPNYIYNAPNKLFEYLSKGLDVWYPREMEGVHPYNTTCQYPQVISFDFKDLQEKDPAEFLRSSMLTYVPFTKSAEDEYIKIIENLTV
jgi:hypothetical protein